MRNTNMTAPPITPPLADLIPFAIPTALIAVGVFFLQQQFIPLTSTPYVGTIVGLAALSGPLFGPSRFVLTTVFAMALLSHHFRSFVILPVGGVEWHPREILLLLLVAHGVIKASQGRFSLRWTPLHVGMLLYSSFFLYAAWRGLWLGADLQAIVAELRAPLFLSAFWVFAGCIRRPEDLYYYGYLALMLITLLALGTIGFFAYGSLTGPLPNLQNALGEFVPRSIGGVTLQSVRPSGHLYFEAGLILCVGMFFCPREPWFRRTIYVGLGTLFTAALAAGMMRTALVSLLVSLVVLAWLNLPQVAKGLSLGIALLLFGVAIAAPLLGQLPLAAPPGDASIHARVAESTGALTAFWQHPFFGAGLGASFEGLDLSNETSRDSAVPVAIDSLHNVWLYFLWKGGLVGLGIIALALITLLRYGNQITNGLPTMSQRCFARCLQAILVGQLVASCTMPRLTFAHGALFLSLWTMAFVLLERLNQTPHGITHPVQAPDNTEDDRPEESLPPAAPSPRPAPNVSPTLEQC